MMKLLVLLQLLLQLLCTNAFSSHGMTRRRRPRHCPSSSSSSSKVRKNVTTVSIRHMHRIHRGGSQTPNNTDNNDNDINDNKLASAWKHKVPNYLTYARCGAIPLMVFLYYFMSDDNNNIYDYNNYKNVLLSVLFAVSSFTDWLDGYLARRWKVTSSFGAFLDPVADKLMVSTALILLSGTYGASVAIPSAIILAREIGVSALREWMAQRGQRDAVKVGFQGKVKTALTMVALTLLLLVPSSLHTSHSNNNIASLLYKTSLMMLYACAVVTVTSGSVYFKAAWPVLTGKE